jgi:hypothetical protein
MDAFASVLDLAKNPATDVLIIVFFLAAGFLWGMFGGKSKVLSFLFASYFTFFFLPIFLKVLDEYGFAKSAYRNITVFFVVIVILFFYFDRGIFRSTARASYRWWQAFLVSFLAVGFFVAGILYFLSFRGIIELSPITLSLFAGSRAYIFWSLAPLVGLLFVSKGR